MRDWTRNNESGDQGRQMDFKYLLEEETSVFADSWIYRMMQREALGVSVAFWLQQLGRWCPIVKR